MKFGKVKNVAREIFLLKNSAEKEAMKLVPEPFLSAA